MEKSNTVTMTKESDSSSKEKIQANAHDHDVEKDIGTVEELPSIDRALERKLLKKFDLHILPLLAVMYLFK